MATDPAKRPAGLRILDALLNHGATAPTFAELAKYANVSLRSMTSFVTALENDGVLARRPVRFASGAGLVLSCSAGSENVKAALIDANGAILHEGRAPLDRTQMSGPPARLLGRIRSECIEVLARGLDDTTLLDADGQLPLLGLAVALPTPIDRQGFARGRVFYDAEWGAVPLRERVTTAFGNLFELDRVDAINDANAGTMAIGFDLCRRRTETHEHSYTSMSIRLGGGIGAGTMQIAPYAEHGDLAFNRSRLVVGSNGLAGELGHLPISDSVLEKINAGLPGGLAPVSRWPCSCGKDNHLEGIASSRALMQRLLDSRRYELVEDEPIGLQVAKLLDAPDLPLVHALRDTGRLVGRALASPILMLDPARITLTGYLARQPVVEGILREQLAWSTNVANDPVITYLSDPRENDFIEVKGAGLAMMRRLVFRRIGVLLDVTERKQLVRPFSRSNLDALASMAEHAPCVETSGADAELATRDSLAIDRAEREQLVHRFSPSDPDALTNSAPRGGPLVETTVDDKDLATRHNLAVAYRKEGLNAEAIAIFVPLLSDRERLLGAGHPDTVATRNRLASAYEAAGHSEDAERLRRQRP